MITVRRADERGRTRLDWLDSRHTFSFGEYRDPQHMGFRDLRVINEDRVIGGAGFATHGHRDMEILTWVLEGALQHRDSLGNGSVIRPGEMQRMSAGTGIMHSELNGSGDELVHFLQIWILPRERGLEPGYEQRAFPLAVRRDRWCLVAASDGRDGAVTVHAPAEVWATVLSAGSEAGHGLAPKRHAWVQIARGTAALNDVVLTAGDGAAISDETKCVLRATDEAEALLFELA